jgi:hypothetical protein
MTSIWVEVTGEHKRASLAIKALATEVSGPLGWDGAKRDRSVSEIVYIVQFRSKAQADRFCRAVERFVPPSLARIHSS